MKLAGRNLAKYGVKYLHHRLVNKAVVLIYHRVTVLPTDPVALCITPAHFDEQMKVLKEHFNPISLAELVEAQVKGKVPDRAVAVTFDDGYEDNLLQAKPILEKYGVPATVFIASGFIDNQHEFYWDDLDRMLLQPGTLPQKLELKIQGHDHHWDLGPDHRYTAEAFARHAGWSTISGSPPPTRRHVLYRELADLLKPLPKEARREYLEKLAAWAGCGLARRATHKTLSAEQIKQLVAGGLVDVGGHTVTHSSLASLPQERQKQEIMESKKELERITGRPVPLFAYPFGTESTFDQITEDLVRQSGFTGAVTTRPGLIYRGLDPMALPRYPARDWDGTEFRQRLNQHFLYG